MLRKIKIRGGAYSEYSREETRLANSFLEITDVLYEDGGFRLCVRLRSKAGLTIQEATLDLNSA